MQSKDETPYQVVTPDPKPHQSSVTSIFADLDKLRLSVSSTVLGGSVEILSKVPVRKPQKQEYVRVHPEKQ